MSGSAIFSRIYNALAQREGKKTTLPTLVSITGLTEVQIKNSINHARKNSEVHARQIEVVTPGKVWKYKGDTSVGGYPTPDDVAKAVEVGSQHIWKTVLAALMTNAGKVTSKQLLAELASTEEREITPQQATQAMLTILRQPGMAGKIETLWANNAWRYVDSSPSVAEAPSATDTPKPPSVPIRGSVLRYFSLKPGETLFLNDIAEDLGFTTKQVQSALWHLLNENEATKNDFVVVQPSYAWQYKPNRATTNGHVAPKLEAAPVQAYTPEAVTTTLPASSAVPSIPPAQPTAVATAGRLFEEIGQTTEGALLLKEAETNTIYRATPLA